MSYESRIRLPELLSRVTSADAAAECIRDGMVVGMSGFTRAGDAKAVPLALAERARREPLKITLMTGASLGSDIDRTLAEAAPSRGACPSRSTRCCAPPSTAAR